jgi:hypothetical protein
MALAINVDGVAGSKENCTPNTSLALTLTGIVGSPTTYNWYLLDAPPGNAATFSSSTISNPTFQPVLEGGYHVRAVVNLGIAGEQVNEVHLIVPEQETNLKTYAAGYDASDPNQSVLDTVDGYGQGTNDVLRAVSRKFGRDAGSIVAKVASGSSVAAGAIVRLVGFSAIGAGAGARNVPECATAQATLDGSVKATLAVAQRAVDGSAGPWSTGVRIIVKLFGVVDNATGTLAATGDPVYLADNNGDAQLTAGTKVRLVGRALGLGTGGAGTFSYFFNGLQGDNMLPVQTLRAGLAIGVGVDPGITVGDRIHVHSVGSDPTNIRMTHANTGTSGTDGFAFGLDPNGDVYLWNYENKSINVGTNNIGRWTFQSDGTLIPFADNGNGIGHSTKRVANAWIAGILTLGGDGAGGGTTAPLSNNTGFLQTNGFIAVQGSLGVRVSGVLEMTGDASNAYVAGAGSGTVLNLYSQLSAGSTSTGVRVTNPNDRSAGYLFDVGDTISAAFSRKFGVQHDGRVEQMPDTDTTAIFGRAKFFPYSSSDQLLLGHFDAGTTDYALRQTADRQNTVLNTGSGGNVLMAVNDSVIATVNVNGLHGGTDAGKDLGQANGRWRRLLMAEYWEGDEIADPAAPAANKGRLYFKDNGSGKTQLVARFPTGAVQVIATEP